MAYTYINANEITDKLVKKFVDEGDSRVSTWLTRVDDEIEHLARMRGVDPDNITDTLNPKVAEYARLYFGYIVCMDNRDYAIQEPLENDKYTIHGNAIKVRLDEIRQEITSEMLEESGDDLNQSDYVGGGTIWLA